MSERKPTDWTVKPPPNVRSVQDALASAEIRRKDLPKVVQVYARDWDSVILADHIAEIKRQRDAAVEALRKLARLGNGDKPGNSIGNQIAIDALAEIEGK